MSGPIIRAAASAAVPAQISQTAFLFAALGFAFLFYVTIRGDLPKWLGLLGLGGSATGAPGLMTPSGQPASAQPGFLGQAVPDTLAGATPALPSLPTVP